MKHRIDWKAVHRIVNRFLMDEVSELEVKREARYMVTSPMEIARHTELDVGTVREHLLEMVEKRVDGKIVLVRIGKTDVVIKLASHSYSTDEDRPVHPGAMGGGQGEADPRIRTRVLADPRSISLPSPRQLGVGGSLMSGWYTA